MDTANKQSVLLCLALVASVLLLAGCSGGDIDPPEAGKTFRIGGTVTGLDGRLQLTLSGAAAQSVELQSRGETLAFEFSSARLKPGQDYEVDALGPDTLRCAPKTAKGWGVVENADIDLDIVCEPFVAIGVDVVGLANGDTLVAGLTYNGKTTELLLQNGFVAVGDGQRYRIGDGYLFMLADELNNPNYRCVINDASHTSDLVLSADGQQLSGRIENDNIIIGIRCRLLSDGAPLYSLGGRVSGLGADRSLALFGQNSIEMSVPDGPFTLPKVGLRAGDSYRLVLNGASLDRHCQITAASHSSEVTITEGGTVIEARVTNGNVQVMIGCQPKFRIGVVINDLGEDRSLGVSLNGVRYTNLVDGDQMLGTQLFFAQQEPYRLELGSESPDLSCLITDASFSSETSISADGQRVTGKVGAGDVMVSINCQPSASLAVTLTGLDGSRTVGLRVNNAAPLSLANGSHILEQNLDSGTAYQLLIDSMPADRICELRYPTSGGFQVRLGGAPPTQIDGLINGVDVVVPLNCTLPYTIGVSVSGLAVGRTLGLNLSGEWLANVSNGDHLLRQAPFTNNTLFDLVFEAIPENHSCAFTDTTNVTDVYLTEAGDYIGGRIDNGDAVIEVVCSAEVPLLEGYIQGLIADGLKLSVTDLGNGQSDTITLGRNTEFFAFPGMLARPGAEYRVDIVRPPNGQLCAFRSGKTGVMDSSNIHIACGAWSSQPGLSIEQPDYITSDLALNQATGEAMLVYGYVQKDQYRSLLKSHSYDPGTKTWGDKRNVGDDATRPAIPIYDDNGEVPPVPYAFEYVREGVQPGIDLNLNNKGDALVAWRHNFLKREYYAEAQDLWAFGNPAVKLRSMQVKRFHAALNRWLDEPGFVYADFDCPGNGGFCTNNGDLNQPGVVLTDNGKIMLSWLQIDYAGNDQARYRFARPTAPFWLAGNYMDTYGWASGATDQMAMAANNSGAAIAAWRWVLDFNGAAQVKVGQLDLGKSADGLWDNSLVIDNGGIEVSDIRVAINDQQQAVALWLRDTNLDTKFSTVEANVYSGGRWRGTLTVADAAPAQQDLIHPQVAMDKQGRALAVWLQQTSAGDNRYRTWASRYDPVQRLWLQAEQLDLPAAADKHLSISLAMNANGQAMLAWRNGSTVRIKAFAADDGGWSDDSHAFSTGGQGASPVVAIDNSGEALVLMDKEYEGASVYRFGWPE